MLDLMKRLLTFSAVLVILMAGFMSVCAADENCNPEAIHTASHSDSDVHASKAASTDAGQDHCGMVCHVASHTLLQTAPAALSAVTLGQNRIVSTDDTIRLGLYTVLDQPPRA